MAKRSPKAQDVIDRCIKGPNNTLVNHLANAQTIFALDRAWRQKADDAKHILGYDQFQSAIVILAPPPWKDHYAGEAWTKPKVWDEVDDSRASIWLAQTYSVKLSEKIIYSAILTTAQQHCFHPVKEYLERAYKAWQGEQGLRVDRLLVDYFGTPYNEYTRDLGRFFSIGAVARIFAPGCKLDLVPIAEGKQGGRKSSAVKLLCPDPEWFYDSDLELGNKDAYQSIRGKWIIELPELDSLSRADEKKIRAFFTSAADTYRPSYGRRSIRVERQCVFFGTTNQGKDQPYLRDETGGRRFAGFEVGEIDIEKIKRDRDLIWGEAVHRYRSGWLWHAEDQASKDRFREQAEARYRVDPWEDQLNSWYELQAMKPDKMTILDVLQQVYKLEHGQMNENNQKQAAKALRRAGWIRARLRVKGSPKWFYVPPEASEKVTENTTEAEPESAF